MNTPEIDVQFIENIKASEQHLNIYGSSYTVQPDIPTWIL